jgi:hypothetical protein
LSAVFDTGQSFLVAVFFEFFYEWVVCNSFCVLLCERNLKRLNVFYGIDVVEDFFD